MPVPNPEPGPKLETEIPEPEGVTKPGPKPGLRPMTGPGLSPKELGLAPGLKSTSPLASEMALELVPGSGLAFEPMPELKPTDV